jgi:hypothetical protein
MDTQTIDQEFEKLQTEFKDVAGTVTSLAKKLQAAEAAGDGNATEWLTDLKQVAKDIDDEQAQAHALLLAIHGFITNLAQAQAADPPAQPDEHPPLFAPGHAPQEQDDDQQGQTAQRHGILGGMFGGGMGGGMMGGGMFGGMGGGMGGGMMMGGYGGGGFARAMEMGAGMSLGANLLNSIFR